MAMTKQAGDWFAADSYRGIGGGGGAHRSQNIEMEGKPCSFSRSPTW